MAELTKEEENLIQKFIGLQTEDSLAPAVTLPATATTSIDWGSCLLARIITNRTTIDASFSKAMIQAWSVDPSTSFMLFKQ